MIMFCRGCKREFDVPGPMSKYRFTCSAECRAILRGRVRDMELLEKCKKALESGISWYEFSKTVPSVSKSTIRNHYTLLGWSPEE